MRVVNEKEIMSVLNIGVDKKFKYFINFICDSQKVWGLYNDGWALAADNELNQKLFPLWPSYEYAELCITNEWNGYLPEPIDLSDLINELIPLIKQDNLMFSIFMTPDHKGIILSPDELLHHINNEMKKY